MKKTVYAIFAMCLLLALSACQKPCEHTYTEAITAQASCVQIGTKTFTCSQCGDSYTEEIAMLAHNFGKATVTKKATCTETGEKSATCTICDKTEVVETIDLAEHKYTSEVTTAATCTAEGVKTYTCSVCSDSFTMSIPKASHSYSSKVTTAATCTAEGVKTYTCSRCSDSYTEKISAKGHNYSSKTTTAATCTSSGTKKYTCSDCGNSYTETISAKGHNWVNATCTKARHCTNCGTTSGSALGHSYSSNGYCPRCGEAPSATIILKDGPRTFSSYSGNRKISSCEITSISIALDEIGSRGLLYEINYTGTCTYTNNHDCIRVCYKVYDSDGFLVHSDSLFASSLAAGDKFRESDTIQYRFTPGETYTIELSDYVY